MADKTAVQLHAVGPLLVKFPTCVIRARNVHGLVKLSEEEHEIGHIGLAFLRVPINTHPVPVAGTISVVEQDNAVLNGKAASQVVTLKTVGTIDFMVSSTGVLHHSVAHLDCQTLDIRDPILRFKAAAMTAGNERPVAQVIFNVREGEPLKLRGQKPRSHTRAVDAHARISKDVQASVANILGFGQGRSLGPMLT